MNALPQIALASILTLIPTGAHPAVKAGADNQAGVGIDRLEPPAGMTCEYTDMNALGEVVGNCSMTPGQTRAVIWRNGGMSNLGGIGGATSRAAAINDRGEVAGSSAAPDGASHAAVWRRDGGITDLGPGE